MKIKSNLTQSSFYKGKEALKQLDNFIKSNYKTAQKIVITDENTLKLCLPVLQRKCRSLKKVFIITIPVGEQHKNENTAHQIWQQLAENLIDRNALVINLGGGVVTDIGGFCAATYKRGIDFINVPTTLMAMADAANGGKTGINLNGLKNVIGTFSLPNAVALDSQFLKTLDDRNILSGYAEMVKHSLVADATLFKKLVRNPIEKNITGDSIYASLKIKMAIVKKDPDEKNLRKLLNFGHTVGHAVESYSLLNDKNPLLHGECVAIGMMIESFLSYRVCKLKKEEMKLIAEYIDNVYVLPKFSAAAKNTIIELMQNDKKNQNGKLNFTLLKKIGQGVINQLVMQDAIENAFLFYNEMAD